MASRLESLVVDAADHRRRPGTVLVDPEGNGLAVRVHPAGSEEAP